MRIAVVTDAWTPQVNGVVRTWATSIGQLRARGHVVEVINPLDFRTVPCPTYPSIPLAVFPGRGVARRLEAFAPDAVHVATEGPLGQAGRRWCLRQRQPFTSSFHTQFPEYVRARAPIPIGWTYAWLRRFHAAAVRTLVPTPSQLARLRARGFEKLVVWPRGVDTELFRPGRRDVIDVPRPIALYVGRVAVEKNLEAFLGLDLPGCKVVIGDGPARASLERAYPSVRFLGEMHGEALARHVAAADVFVFPSLTDTFGLVMLEAMACGVPVAAFPVTGPVDVVDDGRTGVLDWDLARAVRGALALDPSACVAEARARTWSHATDILESNLACSPVRAAAR